MFGVGDRGPDLLFFSSIGQEEKSTGHWRVDNSPIATRVAKLQQTSASLSKLTKPISAGCTRRQQRKKKKPTTSQRAAEAQLKL
jgi:hypothetical protein